MSVFDETKKTRKKSVWLASKFGKILLLLDIKTFQRYKLETLNNLEGMGGGPQTSLHTLIMSLYTICIWRLIVEVIVE